MNRFLFTATSLLLLTACGGDLPDALFTDSALNGRFDRDGTLTTVAVRPVFVGRNEDRRAPACVNRVAVRGESATVRWSPDASSPNKAVVTGEVLACDSAGDWTGIIFPGAGETVDYCNLNRRIARPTEYQGPCRSGWVRTGELATQS